MPAVRELVAAAPAPGSVAGLDAPEPVADQCEGVPCDSVASRERRVCTGGLASCVIHNKRFFFA